MARQITGAGREASAAAVSRPVALVVLLVVAVVWGGNWPVTRVGVRSIPPLTYGALRLVTGLAVVVTILALQRRLRLPDRADLPVVLSVGLVQIGVGVAVMNLGLAVVQAGRAAVLTYSMPVWVALLLVVRRRRAPTRSQGLGLTLGTVGIALLALPVVRGADLADALGVTILLVGAMTWAAVTLHVRSHRWTTGTWDLQPWQLLVGLVPIALLAAVVEHDQPMRWTTGTVLALLYSGPLAAGFGFWAITTVTRALGPLAAGIGFLAIPVVGLITGWIFLGERLGAIDVVASALVLAGVAVTTLVRAPEDDDAAPTIEAVPG